MKVNKNYERALPYMAWVLVGLAKLEHDFLGSDALLPSALLAIALGGSILVVLWQFCEQQYYLEKQPYSWGQYESDSIKATQEFKKAEQYFINAKRRDAILDKITMSLWIMGLGSWWIIAGHWLIFVMGLLFFLFFYLLLLFD